MNASSLALLTKARIGRRLWLHALLALGLVAGSVAGAAESTDVGPGLRLPRTLLAAAAAPVPATEPAAKGGIDSLLADDNLEEAPAPTPDSTPRARLLALFQLTDAGGGQMRGCPFHNAAVEAAGAMPGVEHIVHLHKRDYVDGLTELAREAGAADPEMLGNQIALLYEGASGLSTSINDPAPWAQARATAEVLIDLATTRAA